MTFALGARVKFRPGVPRAYQAALGLVGTVEDVCEGDRVTLVRVAFDRAEPLPPLTIKDIPTAYLIGAAGEKAKTQTRRGALHLHEPTDDRTESEKQLEAVKWLTRADIGYRVLLTGQVVKQTQCPACHTSHWPHTGFGNTKGFPDLTIYHPTHWAPAGERRAALLLEFKQSENAARKPEQIALVDAGVSAFVWSLPMVARELYRFEKDVLGITPHPAVTRFLEDLPA